MSEPAMKRKREGNKEDLSLSDPQEQETELTARVDDSEHPITELSLFAGRKLSAVPPSLFLPKLQLCVSLGTLNLSRNEIKQLPAAIGSLVALVHLDVSRNFIRRLPEELKALVNLKHCNASSNQFKGLSDLALDQLAYLPALRVLDMEPSTPSYSRPSLDQTLNV
jgi:Leucine-rich repeat (LRR) protein